jgi:hypothetical protein
MGHRERAFILILTEDNDRLRERVQELENEKIKYRWMEINKTIHLVLFARDDIRRVETEIHNTIWDHRKLECIVCYHCEYNQNNDHVNFAKRFNLPANINFVSLRMKDCSVVCTNDREGRFYVAEPVSGDAVYITSKTGFDLIYDIFAHCHDVSVAIPFTIADSYERFFVDRDGKIEYS